MSTKSILVPLGGNSFVTNKSQCERDGITPAGWENWTNDRWEYHIYFKPAIEAELTLTMLCHKTEHASRIRWGIGQPDREISVEAGATEIPLGTCRTSAGYVDVAVQGVSREGDIFSFPTALRVEGIEDAEMAAYASESDRQDFYWIRRGPSVHGNYDADAAGEDVEWFYNEAAVMPGEDPDGTYCMAIGFFGGYFGMQVCHEGNRKLLFSIWSPYNTNDPSTIPEDQRIRVLRKHPRMHTGEFGNEGSGGQSYMDYQWESGKKYKFLCHIRPVENDCTEYTAYFFFPESGKWELLCSFLRPKTQTWVRRAHSFLESFVDVNGHRFRRAHFYNPWMVTTSGKWIPVDRMRLTGDNAARKAQRQDYGGGSKDNHFYLQNCGFFSPHTLLDTVFPIDTSCSIPPAIDLTIL